MKSKSIQNAICLFSFLLCGIVFCGIRAADNPASSLVSGILGAGFAFVVCAFYTKIKNDAHQKPISQSAYHFLCFAAVFFSCLICAGNAFSFAASLEDFSQKLSGARFSHFFIILCFVLCAYAAKRGFESFSRICLIMIIPVILPYVVSWFAFIGYSAPLDTVLPQFSLSADINTFFSVFSLCVQLTVFFIAFRKEKNLSGKSLRYAFLAFLLVFLLESVKYFLFFGASGVTFVKRPDRIMLAAVPFVNVQDLFVFSYFFAFMLRNTVLFAASAKLMGKCFPQTRENKKIAVSVKSAPAVVSYLLYILCRVSPDFCTFSMSPFPAVAFAVFVIAAGFPARIKQNK